MITMKLARLTARLGDVLREHDLCLDIDLPTGEALRLGDGEPSARVNIHSERAFKHLLSFQEDGLAEAYVRGELDVQGSFPHILECRAALTRIHRARCLARFAVPALFGQVFTNRIAIRRHYELDPDFYLSFLDRIWPAYSQGVYERPGESLSSAIERKFALATEALRLEEGDHVLEIGPGWGAYIRYVLARGMRITAITNSPSSRSYLDKAFVSPQLRVVGGDFLSFNPDERFNAITIMGVMEHLPQYGRVCHKIRTLLKPDGYAYIDASASRSKYAMSPFIYKHIFPYNHSFLHLGGFLKAASSARLELVSLNNDSDSYQRTLEAWAANLESNRDDLLTRFAEYDYRRFRLYLWGSAQAFKARVLQCYRLVLRIAK